MAYLIAEDGTVRVRDSKDKAGPALMFSPDQWKALVSFVGTEEAGFGVI